MRISSVRLSSVHLSDVFKTSDQKGWRHMSTSSYNSYAYMLNNKNHTCIFIKKKKKNDLSPGKKENLSFWFTLPTLSFRVLRVIAFYWKKRLTFDKNMSVRLLRTGRWGQRRKKRQGEMNQTLKVYYKSIDRLSYSCFMYGILHPLNWVSHVKLRRYFFFSSFSFWERGGGGGRLRAALREDGPPKA